MKKFGLALFSALSALAFTAVHAADDTISITNISPYSMTVNYDFCGHDMCTLIKTNTIGTTTTTNKLIVMKELSPKLEKFSILTAFAHDMNGNVVAYLDQPCVLSPHSGMMVLDVQASTNRIICLDLAHS